MVVENVWTDGTSTDSSGVYHPRIRFHTATGEEVEFLSKVGSAPPSYRENQAVEVLYDPADPRCATINSFWELYLVSVILFGIGVIFSGLGFGGLWLSRPFR